MDGSDLAGAVACENTHGPTPQPGRPEAGSLPSPSERPRPATAGRGAETQGVYRVTACGGTRVRISGGLAVRM